MTVDFSLMRGTAAATWMMLSCCAALAGELADDDSPRWTIGGYGTLGLARSDNHQADFTANVLNPGDSGYTRGWSPVVDSRVGVQLGANLGPAWSAVLQLLSERTLADGYAPKVEWASLQYQATPDLSLRVGRIALPLFLTGEYRKAGYTLPWVRPPVELYGAIPLSNSDGVDATYRWQAGDANNVTQFFLGRTDLSIAGNARAQARGLAGVTHTATSGALTVRASVLTAELSVDLTRTLFAGIRQFGAPGQALADRYELSSKRAYVASAGFSYDPGNWFLMGEVGRMNARSYLGDRTAGYASAGYRHGDLTPYLVCSLSRANMATRVDGLETGGLPAQSAAVATQLNAGLNQVLAAIPQQHTVAAGVRWDLHPNYALKLQYDRITPRHGSTGTFINVQPGFRSGRPVGVLSAALDLVF